MTNKTQTNNNQIKDEQPSLEKTPYELLGGEDELKKLVNLFYDFMDTEVSSEKLRGLHAKSLKASREKLFLFLSGWLGGPNLYIDKYGHPMLRRRHLPFVIGDDVAQQWIDCMQQAMDELNVMGELRVFLDQSFQQMALHMRNQ